MIGIPCLLKSGNHGVEQYAIFVFKRLERFRPVVAYSAYEDNSRQLKTVFVLFIRNTQTQPNSIGKAF